MQRSSKSRIEALEALEGSGERHLTMDLFMPTADYVAYFEADDTPAAARAALECAYGFDQLRPNDRVRLHVNAWGWNAPIAGWERTIFVYNGPDGARAIITEWTQAMLRRFPCDWPEPGGITYSEAITSEIEDYRREKRRAVERQAWVRPSDEQIATLRAALASGRLYLDLRVDHSPVWYDFTPPAPYPEGVWQTPAYLAGKAVSRALHEWQAIHGWWKPTPEMPTTADAVLTWLETFDYESVEETIDRARTS
jgi:hypothetical protein